jgi:exosortase family protein XrtF
MISSFKNLSPAYRFLIVFAGLAIVWYPLYTFLLKPHSPIDEWVIGASLTISKSILQLLGHTVFVDGREIRIAGTSGLWMGDECNAISLFALFSGFILSFPGNIKSKCWFIPVGIALIFMANCIRVIILAVLDVYSREWTKFNHTYTFTILMYGLIFLLWMYWVNRYSYFGKKTTLGES